MIDLISLLVFVMIFKYLLSQEESKDIETLGQKPKDKIGKKAVAGIEWDGGRGWEV